MRSVLHTCRRHTARIALWLLIAALCACGSTSAPVDAVQRDGAVQGDTAAPAQAPTARPIGGDRDAQGCLPAAGYRWCAREQRCVRPWELAKQAGFADTAEGFAAYCAAPRPAPAR